MFKSKAKRPTEDSKPSDFALALGVSKHKKKFAQGGKVETPKAPDIHEAASKEAKSISDGIEAEVKAKQAQGKPGYAKGGPIEDSMAESIADHIIQKRHRMAEGGVVDLGKNSEEVGRSPFDRYNADAGNEEQYDLDQLSAQPEDSNEHGDDLDDADAHSMIDKIRQKLKAKRG